jgi:hypothetical protein
MVTDITPFIGGNCRSGNRPRRGSGGLLAWPSLASTHVDAGEADIWTDIFYALTGSTGQIGILSIDSTHIKVHRSAAGARPRSTR